VIVPFTLSEDTWDSFELNEVDIEFLYQYLLEQETPLTTRELTRALVSERIRLVKESFEKQFISGKALYLPKETYQLGHSMIFPAFGWAKGEVTGIRPGRNPEIGPFDVINVRFENGESREFAARLADHKLNTPPEIDSEHPFMNPDVVMETFGEDLFDRLETALKSQPGFVRIAGRWFPRALLMDITMGNLNLAEAVLDMAGGGPLPTSALLEQLEIPQGLNPNLVNFSLELALQEDPRFDEVGPAGETLWFLRRLEPAHVQEPPIYLRYGGYEYDRNVLTAEMLEFERSLDDELSPVTSKGTSAAEVEIRLIFPHLRAGTLPLSSRLRHLIPTAYEAPRVRFTWTDGVSGEKFPGWVVREKRYIFGLSDWYRKYGLIPGSILKVRRSPVPGEVIIQAETRRPTRDWMRTVLVGSDGGIVYAMLKQPVSSLVDDRMAISIPDPEALDEVWMQPGRLNTPLIKVVVQTVRELARLNPQSHVHASELYAAINIVRRCPPGPILALLATRPNFVHVGDLHYRFVETEETKED
jgi:hypothetical protein